MATSSAAAVSGHLPALPVAPLERDGGTPAGAGGVSTVLGTMSYAAQTADDDAAAQMRAFVDAGFVDIDCARMYAFGRSEELIGRVLSRDDEGAGVKARMRMSTKANPFPGFGDSLSADSVRQQLEASLAAVGLDQVAIFYLHAPDHTVSLDETLAAVQELFKEGKFAELGLSNFAAWQVSYIWGYMQSRGWVVPTVYQVR
jgi:aflatoxin B1 aldehyde reductase